MNVIADIVAEIAAAAAVPGSTKSPIFGFDEPECPQELL